MQTNNKPTFSLNNKRNNKLCSVYRMKVLKRDKALDMCIDYAVNNYNHY
jgi:hypothetical protein